MVYEWLVNYFHMFPSISLMFDVELNKRPQVPFRTLMSYLKFKKISTILITLVIAFLIGINPALKKLGTKAVDRGWLIQHNYKQREQRSTAKVLVLRMFQVHWYNVSTFFWIWSQKTESKWRDKWQGNAKLCQPTIFLMLNNGENLFLSWTLHIKWLLPTKDF